MTEFGAVDYSTRDTFMGIINDDLLYADVQETLGTNSLIQNDLFTVMRKFHAWITDHTKGRAIFVSDNPAFDWQWINDAFHTQLGENPFGHSARRISDFYAGLVGDFAQTQKWKALRVTPHDHNPVHDALGNVEAFERLINGERP
jgi:hypothetical protein